MELRRLKLAGLLAGLVLMGSGAPPVMAAELQAVASFTILADMVERVGGERVEVAALVGADGDAHAYEPTPAAVRAMAAADVVVVNGLGFEGWLDRLIKASGYGSKPIVATAGIGAAAAGDARDHAPHAPDPHAWQNVAHARAYVRTIAAGLCSVDAAGCEAYKANAAAYDRDLAALDAEIKAAIARVPQDRRVVITTHDSFGHFARAYGLTFLAPEGLSTESEASARDVARLIAQIRAHKASAVFVENVSDPRLVEQIARETGVAIGGRLYSDALSSEDGPAATYVAMMRHNLRLLSQAMLGS